MSFSGTVYCSSPTLATFTFVLSKSPYLKGKATLKIGTYKVERNQVGGQCETVRLPQGTTTVTLTIDKYNALDFFDAYVYFDQTLNSLPIGPVDRIVANFR